MPKKQRIEDVRDEEPDASSGWACTVDLFPIDTMLRGKGYVIAARPEKGPTLWRRGQDIITEEHAVSNAVQA